jgi:biopolymer transport protein TolQ
MMSGALAGGAAFLLQDAAGPRGSVLGLLANGTPISWIVLAFLLVLSGISWFIMLSKWREFRAVREAGSALQVMARQAESFSEVVDRARLGEGSPMFEVLQRAERFLNGTRPALAGTPERAARLSVSQVEALQMVMDSEARTERSRLERLLPWLATIGAVSPLIGLFGTVIGVINAFLGVAAAGSGNISAVAPGVAEALVATALALVVAIPAVFGYNAFANRLNHLDGEIDAFSTDLIALLVREGRI